GAACLYAIAHLENLPQPPDVVVFVPGHGRTDPGAIPALLRVVEDEGAELAVAMAARGGLDRAVPGLIGTVYRHRVHAVGDASSLRAIRFPALVALGMTDRGGGWDVEMLVRALKLGLTVVEVESAPSADARAPRLGDRARSIFHILRHATMR